MSLCMIAVKAWEIGLATQLYTLIMSVKCCPVKDFETGRYNMEDISQLYDDFVECGPFNFDEPVESTQVNHHQAPPPSFGDLTFDPQQILEAPSSGVGSSIQQFDQSIMLEESLNFNLVNTQFPNGQTQNIVAENNGAEEIEQGWPQRIRWTNEMVTSLINAVSYYEDVISIEVSESDWNPMLPPLKGKWRYVSNTLVEKGFLVSPQQCEDKFNDLNKKFKRLIQILGTATSYSVIENPRLIEGINIPEEPKDEVRRILTCRQLFFKEMYSYHNKNANLTLVKKRKIGEDNGDDITKLPEGMGEAELNEFITTRSFQIKEKKLEIKMKRLNLDKRRFEFLKSWRKEDEELQQMQLENKRMQLENKRQAFMFESRKRSSSSSY